MSANSNFRGAIERAPPRRRPLCARLSHAEFARQLTPTIHHPGEVLRWVRQDLDADVVGARRMMLADALRDRAGVAPGDDRVNQPVGAAVSEFAFRKPSAARMRSSIGTGVAAESI